MAWVGFGLWISPQSKTLWSSLQMGTADADLAYLKKEAQLRPAVSGDVLGVVASPQQNVYAHLGKVIDRVVAWDLAAEHVVSLVSLRQLALFLGAGLCSGRETQRCMWTSGGRREHLKESTCKGEFGTCLMCFFLLQPRASTTWGSQYVRERANTPPTDNEWRDVGMWGNDLGFP